MSARVSFYTFGCRLNQAETASIARGFERCGYDVVDFSQPADMVVVNTCTVTENGDADTLKLVRRIARRQPTARVALVGCQAQLQASDLKDLANVHWVVGNNDKMDLVSIINADPHPAETAVHAGAISRQPFTLTDTSVDHLHTRANLKIQDGCDFFCLFCTIPYARGRGRSRVFADLMQSARDLLTAGHRELILTGVNVGTYEHEDRGILQVVQSLLQLPDLLRLRISSIEPTTIPTALFPLMAGDTPLCRHLHIPLQSGSDHVLKKMNRRYLTAEYRDFLLQAHQAIPDLCLGTDVMVGYPVETEAHFDETVDFLRELPFAYFHVFSYSERELAKSDLLGPPLDVHEVRRRSRLLRQLSDRKRHLYMERFIGRDVPILFEQQKDGWWTGLSDTYIRVKVRSNHDLTNHHLPVRLEAIDGLAMTGQLA